jgi:hypothetical protein
MNYINEDYSLLGYGNMMIVNNSWHFRGDWCLHLRGSYWTALNIKEASSSISSLITNQHGITLIFTLHSFHRSITARMAEEMKHVITVYDCTAIKSYQKKYKNHTWHKITMECKTNTHKNHTWHKSEYKDTYTI